MRRDHSTIAQIAARVEEVLFGSGWAVRLARRVGLRPAIRVTHQQVTVRAPATQVPELRIGYASDFHAGYTTDPDVLRDAVDRLREAAPDVLLLGGDFVTSQASEIDWLAPALGQIPAPFGRFAVLGNHDWWSDPARISRALEGAGIQVLVNRNVRLAPPFDHVFVCGLDDHWCGRPDAVQTMQGADGVRIVLMHAPSGLADLGSQRFDLALCGHTHGGQVALPGGIPIVVPQGSLSRRYARGRYSLAPDRTLIVSLGVGCVLLPLRLFADPEVVVCRVTSADSVGRSDTVLRPARPHDDPIVPA